MRFIRLFKILWVARRFGLDEFLVGPGHFPFLRLLLHPVSAGHKPEKPRAVRLRQALETLGPIFVKFGQVLSTRRDLLPADIADELARLQDSVPPFDSEVVVQTLERVYVRPLRQVFANFDLKPVASASVAQVHLAQLPDGTRAAVKILRPKIGRVIANDVALLYSAA